MSALPSPTLAAAAQASPALRGAASDADASWSTQDTLPLPLTDLTASPPARAANPWDLPLRLFHLGLLLSVGTALVTAWIGGNAMVWHGRAGAVVAGLLGFRLVWGLLGSPTSRFRQFLPSPRSLRDYLQGRWQGVGHNPLGALAVFAILSVLGGQVLTGLFSNDEIAFTGPYAAAVSEELSLTLTGWHQLLAWGVYGLLGLHVLAIAVHEGLKRHRLVGPMFRLSRSRAGRSAERPTAGRAKAGRATAALVLALALGATALLLSWERAAPAAAAPAAGQETAPAQRAW